MGEFSGPHCTTAQLHDLTVPSTFPSLPDGCTGRRPGAEEPCLQPEAMLQLAANKSGWAWHGATAAAPCVGAVAAPSLACEPRWEQHKFLQQPPTRTAPASEQRPRLLSGAKQEPEPCLHKSCLVLAGLRNNLGSRQGHTQPF